MSTINKITLAMILTVLSAFVFLFQETADQTVPFKARGVVSVDSWDSSRPKDAVVDQLQEFADENHVNIYKITPQSTSSGEESTSLYAFIGDSGQHRADYGDAGYPTFRRGYQEDFVPGSQV